MRDARATRLPRESLPLHHPASEENHNQLFSHMQYTFLAALYPWLHLPAPPYPPPIHPSPLPPARDPCKYLDAQPIIFKATSSSASHNIFPMLRRLLSHLHVRPSPLEFKLKPPRDATPLLRRTMRRKRIHTLLHMLPIMQHRSHASPAHYTTALGPPASARAQTRDPSTD